VAENGEAFRITLCAVKEWAIINGLYSNVLGFLGGINFAILVAWVCKRHPEHQPPSLLRIFFRTFGEWYVHGNQSTYAFFI
jgi:poly(A) polymerase